MLIPRTLTRLCRQAIQYQSVRCMGAPGLGDLMQHPDFETRVIESGASMDNMPSPAGDFMTEYSKRQKKFNMHLLGAIAFAIATSVWGYQTNVFEWGIFQQELPPINIYDHIPEHDADADREIMEEMAAAVRAFKNSNE